MNSSQEQRRRRAMQRRKQVQRNRMIAVAIVVVLVVLTVIAVHNLRGGSSADTEQTGVTESGSASGTHALIIASGDADVIRPTAQAPEDPVADSVQEWIETHTLEEKIAQMFFVTPEELTGVSLVTAAGETSKSRYEEYPVGGIIYQAQNLTDENQTKEMLANMLQYTEDAADIPAFIGINEEGGTISQLADNAGFSVTAVDTMQGIGATADSKLAYQAGNTIGDYLTDLGFNFDFAPSGDIMTDADTSMSIERSFGSDTEMVSEMVQAMIRGLTEKEIIPVIKHFPGHGGATVDESSGYAVLDASLEDLLSTNMMPFRDAIDEGINVIMVSHIICTQIDPDVPATMSSEIMQTLLRDKLDYKGIIITDAMTLNAVVNDYGAGGAAVAAISAGADMILMPSDFTEAYSAVVSAVESGEISEDQIDESVERILKVKYTSLTDVANTAE